MINIVLDTNIHIRLEKEPTTVATITQLIEAGQITILMPRSVADELRPKTGTLPNLFAVQRLGHSVARMGMMRCGDSFGAGAMYDAHLGNGGPKHKADALIADVASYANWFVSDDARCINAFRRNLVITACVPFTYDEFCGNLAELAQRHAL
ncbi:hypothetical protein [Paraburkholderia bryophila]|uniref:PIN domain-containing protein n=1 Tax=Paraburkholderia bryophila TaxID=420952 RepID=A0A329BRE5_9BURK|nr:hypothetical protein [Paraburkholderia bryophila]RAS21515.1 hypothetical protein BX591_12834 [Paraburkholderia bryophila]